MTLSAASITPLHHPLLPGWPRNVGSKRRPGHYRHVSARQGHYGVDSGKSFGDEKEGFDARAMVYKIPGERVGVGMAVPSPGQTFSSHLTVSEMGLHFFFST